MRKIFLILFGLALFIICCNTAMGQSSFSGIQWDQYDIAARTAVATGNKNIRPDTSAAFQVGKDTTAYGMLLPRVIDTVIYGQKKGLFIYRLLDNKIYYHNGTRWNQVGGTSGGSGSDEQTLSVSQTASQTTVNISNGNSITFKNDTSNTNELTDTSSLSARINLKLNISDTANKWLPVGTVIPAAVDTSSLSARINQRVKYTDTVAMLLPYLRKADTANHWLPIGTVIPAQLNLSAGTNVTITGSYPNLTVSAAGGGGVSTDTTSLSLRIDARVKYTDTAAMLLPYGTAIGNRVKYSDTAAMLAPYVRHSELNDTSSAIRAWVVGLGYSTGTIDSTTASYGLTETSNALKVDTSLIRTVANSYTKAQANALIPAIPADSTTAGYGLTETSNQLKVDTSLIRTVANSYTKSQALGMLIDTAAAIRAAIPAAGTTPSWDDVLNIDPVAIDRDPTVSWFGATHGYYINDGPAPMASMTYNGSEAVIELDAQSGDKVYLRPGNIQFNGTVLTPGNPGTIAVLSDITGGSGASASDIHDSIDAHIVQVITNSDTVNAPSGDAVYDALALKQPLDADLTTVAGLTPANNDVMQYKSSAWANRTLAQFIADLIAANLFSSPTITTPTIASFTNATHNHTNAAGGGQITDAALSAAVGVAKGGTGGTSATAYGVVVGGTSSTGAFQNAGTGTSAQYLKGAGGSAIPTWGTFATDVRTSISATGNELAYNNTTGVISKNKATQTLTDGATVTFNVASGYNAKVTLGGNRTLAFSNLADGEYYTLIVIQDGTGSRTLALPAGTKVIGGGAGAVTLTTAASSQDILTFFYSGTTLYCNYGKNYN